MTITEFFEKKCYESHRLSLNAPSDYSDCIYIPDGYPLNEGIKICGICIVRDINTVWNHESLIGERVIANTTSSFGGISKFVEAYGSMDVVDSKLFKHRIPDTDTGDYNYWLLIQVPTPYYPLLVAFTEALKREREYNKELVSCLVETEGERNNLRRELQLLKTNIW